MDGIFVNGEPLKQFVEKEEINDIQEERTETINNIEKILPKRIIRPKESRYVKHSRVKTLFIPKGKMIMQESHLLRAFRLLNGRTEPMTLKEISKELATPQSCYYKSIMSALKVIPEFITAGGKPIQFHLEGSPVLAYNAYKSKIGKTPKKIITECNGPNPEKPAKTSPLINLSNLPSSIKIIVEGEVKIRFILG